jgi:hypothetical protein
MFTNTIKRVTLMVAILLAVAVALTPRAADAAGYPYAQRINFAPGAISATVYGYLPVNGVNQWVMRIFGGQTLTVQLSAMYGNAAFDVVGANGALIGSGTTRWSGAVPQTQDYYITIRAYNNTAPRYTMTVTAPPTPQPAPVPQHRDVNGTWDSTNYIVELNQAIGCMNADCPITGRLIHITSGAPEIVNISGAANSISGTVSFHTELAGGQRFNGTVSANSRTLSGTLSGAGWITFTRR